MSDELDIVTEALGHLRGHYTMWLELKLTTPAERRLAAMKIALIDEQMDKESHGKADGTAGADRAHHRGGQGQDHP